MRGRIIKMKQLIISIMVMFIIEGGLAQSQLTEDKKNDSPQEGPKVERVEIDRDYFGDMQRAEQKNKDLSHPQTEKTVVVKDMDKTNSSTKYYSSKNNKPNQIIRTNEAIKVGPGNDQIYSRRKSTKKIGYVVDIAPRENIKKIEGHAPVDADVLIRALGNPKPVERQSSKTK